MYAAETVCEKAFVFISYKVQITTPLIGFKVGRALTRTTVCVNF